MDDDTSDQPGEEHAAVRDTLVDLVGAEPAQAGADLAAGHVHGVFCSPAPGRLVLRSPPQEPARNCSQPSRRTASRERGLLKGRTVPAVRHRRLRPLGTPHVRAATHPPQRRPPAPLPPQGRGQPWRPGRLRRGCGAGRRRGCTGRPCGRCR
jgi:hypothetical protein